jgi:hypothetical protein
VLRALDGFARPIEVSWTSASAGEDAAAQDLDHAKLPVPLESPVEDPTAVDLALALRCATPDGRVRTTRHGGDVWVEIGPDHVDIVLSLDLDLYAWRSWDHVRDNRAIAELNAPRLRLFLGQVDAYGFRPPES